MDYKEKYEMALEGIQEILSSGEDSIKMSRLQLRLQGIFPELKESEGELTWLTRFIKEEAFSLSMDIRNNEDRIKLKKLQKSLEWLEKQGEQKPADKVEPKFKVGDWLQYRNAKPFFVEEITKQGYVNGISCLPFNWENEIHLWSIKDAKVGDVLVHNSFTFIFMGIKDGIVQAIEENMLEPVNFGKPDEDSDYSPATKEQRETLFNAIHEAGYEWSSKHRKLIKNDACVALTKKMLYDIILDLKVFRDKDCSAEGKAAYQREIDWLENLKKELEDSYDQ